MPTLATYLNWERPGQMRQSVITRSPQSVVIVGVNSQNTHTRARSPLSPIFTQSIAAQLIVLFVVVVAATTTTTTPAMNKNVDFKMEKIIDKTIENKLKCSTSIRSNTNRTNASAAVVKTEPNQISRHLDVVGRVTTYNTVGERNYKNLFDEKKINYYYN
uniref:Uncharacterized protein n=1 Tax=Lymantria dispar multicapsid nuclear polyhedrosis virus TaxID=10449 RepID=A0A1B1MQS3_NPVLD|nr:hypothetical protein [Lymantria dispar multiple nucleopolyhedrovirus]